MGRGQASGAREPLMDRGRPLAGDPSRANRRFNTPVATPSRTVPRVDAAVTIVYLNGSTRGIVQQVDTDLRGLQVLTEEGEMLRFELSRVTGHFMSGGQAGPRLLFETGSESSDGSG
jgi:hypothetical protein